MWKVAIFGGWTRVLLYFRKMHIMIHDGMIIRFKIRKNCIYLYSIDKIGGKQ